MSSLENIVADYMNRYRERAVKELRWFAILRTLEDAVSVAALATGPSGKRLSHQRRIKEPPLAKRCRRLLASLPRLRQARSFEQLHQIVGSQIRSVPGIGERTVYDTALRIGAKLRLEPNTVFLHAGTRLGARMLGLDVSHEFIPVEKVPRALRRLRAREIEDVLCIYKDRFVGLASPRTQSACCYG
jgi:hypothetical protein